MGLILVLTTAVVGGVGTIGFLIYYLLKKRRENHLGACKDFKTALLQEINSRSRGTFSMSQFVQQCGVTEKVAKTVATELYAVLWDKTLEDGVITDDEKSKLAKLAGLFDLTSDEQKTVGHLRKAAKYKEKVDKVLSDGAVSEMDQRELMQLRKSLGLSNEQSTLIAGTATKDAYLVLFRKVIDDGAISPQELKDLQRFREAFAMSANDANQVTHDDALNLYQEWFYGIVNSGQINDDQERALEWLAKEFALEERQLQKYRDQIAELKVIAKYRQGELPKVQTRKLLESGEICHLEQDCQFQWETRTRMMQVQGELLVTNNRVLFFSPTKSFSFSPAKIHDIECRRNHMNLQTSTTKGTGCYFTHSPRKVAAILEGLVKKYNYLLLQKFSSTYTRHIPPEVKREVWQRDNGKCVQCGSRDYLEFDHIIPHSKGGANSTGNVQILCRGCNNEKRDRI